MLSKLKLFASIFLKFHLKNVRLRVQHQKLWTLYCEWEWLYTWLTTDIWKKKEFKGQNVAPGGNGCSHDSPFNCGWHEVAILESSLLNDRNIKGEMMTWNLKKWEGPKNKSLRGDHCTTSKVTHASSFQDEEKATEGQGTTKAVCCLSSGSL